MQVYLTLDPESRRVAAQDHAFGGSDFPRGRQGEGWPTRHLTVDDPTWQALLAGRVPPGEQDALHVQWWDSAAAPGAPPWPDLPTAGAGQ